VNVKALQLKQDQNAHEMKLIQYQIDTVNNLVVGLFGFQEKRTDEYPSVDAISNLVAQLGDTGATSWVQP
jgi:hypothetical protein